MALKVATTTDEVILLGVTEPRPYEAGTTDNGTPFPAGKSMKVCVGSIQEDDFYVMKVKTADVDAVWSVLKDVGRGHTILAEYSRERGQYRMHSAVLVGVPSPA